MRKLKFHYYDCEHSWHEQHAGWYARAESATERAWLEHAQSFKLTVAAVMAFLHKLFSRRD